MIDRSKYIGASEVGAIMGLSEYGLTPQDIWERKLGKGKEQKSSIQMEFGLFCEPFIKAQYEKDYDTVDFHPNNDETIINPKYPWLGCHPDGLVNDIIWEAKSYAFYDIHKEGAKLDWLCQVLTEMLILKKHVAHIACFNHSSLTFDVIEVLDTQENAQRTMESIIVKTKDFWDNYILTGQPPETLKNEALDLKVLPKGEARYDNQEPWSSLLREYIEGYRNLKAMESDLTLTKKTLNQLMLENDLGKVYIDGVCCSILKDSVRITLKG